MTSSAFDTSFYDFVDINSSWCSKYTVIENKRDHVKAFGHEIMLPNVCFDTIADNNIADVIIGHHNAHMFKV